VQVPEAAVADRGRQTPVARDAARHEGRAPGIAEDRDALPINVRAGDDIVDDGGNGALELGTADDLFERVGTPPAQEIDRQQRHATVPCMMRVPGEQFFLAAAGLADTDHDRRLAAAAGRRQEIALQGVMVEPGNLNHAAFRRQLIEIVAGAALHPRHHQLTALVAAIQMLRCGLIIADGTQPIALRGPAVATVQRAVAALMAGIGGLLPFKIPAVLVAWIDPARGAQAFGHRGAAILSRRQQPNQVVRQILVIRPIPPRPRFATSLCAACGLLACAV